MPLAAYLCLYILSLVAFASALPTSPATRRNLSSPGDWPIERHGYSSATNQHLLNLPDPPSCLAVCDAQKNACKPAPGGNKSRCYATWVTCRRRCKGLLVGLSQVSLGKEMKQYFSQLPALVRTPLQEIPTSLSGEKLPDRSFNLQKLLNPPNFDRVIAKRQPCPSDGGDSYASPALVSVLGVLGSLFILFLMWAIWRCVDRKEWKRQTSDHTRALNNDTPPCTLCPVSESPNEYIQEKQQLSDIIDKCATLGMGQGPMVARPQAAAVGPEHRVLKGESVDALGVSNTDALHLQRSCTSGNQSQPLA